MMKTTVSVLILFITASSMAAPNCTNSFSSYYPQVNCNLTQITWAHAVNSQEELSDALNNAEIMMLEADIVLGTIFGSSGPEIPIMAHPPNNQSDLSLEEFLARVKTYNENSVAFQKGVKLDFKTIEALEGANEVISNANITFPLMINSDIISGPINATGLPVDPTRFFAQAKNYRNATLSIGWTTRYGPLVTSSYQTEQINEMLRVILRNNITQDITFPVRAGLAAESLDLFKDLLEKVDGSTLTIWSSEGDKVNVDHLRELIRTIGLSNVFVDVPEDLMKLLHLDDL